MQWTGGPKRAFSPLDTKDVKTSALKRGVGCIEEMTLLPVILLLVALVAVSLVWGLLELFKANRRAGITIGVIALLLAALLTFAVASHRPIYETRTQNFAEAVKAAIDPDELQTWATNLIHGIKADKSLGLRDLEVGQVPRQLRELQSNGSPLQYLWVNGPSDQTPETTLVLVWGGGFGHWGIHVGSPSFRHTNDTTYQIEWKPGIYFWHDSQ